jgi:hypothetical protein
VGKKRYACRVLVWKPEVKRPLGRSGSRGEDNIIMDSKEMNRKDVDWISLALCRDKWRAVVNTVMNIGFHETREIS